MWRGQRTRRGGWKSSVGIPSTLILWVTPPPPSKRGTQKPRIPFKSVLPPWPQKRKVIPLLPCCLGEEHWPLLLVCVVKMVLILWECLESVSHSVPQVRKKVAGVPKKSLIPQEQVLWWRCQASPGHLRLRRALRASRQLLFMVTAQLEGGILEQENFRAEVFKAKPLSCSHPARASAPVMTSPAT